MLGSGLIPTFAKVVYQFGQKTGSICIVLTLIKRKCVILNLHGIYMIFFKSMYDFIEFEVMKYDAIKDSKDVSFFQARFLRQEGERAESLPALQQTQEPKLSGFLTKTPQDIRKRRFKLEKHYVFNLFQRFLQDLQILVLFLLGIERCHGREFCDQEKVENVCFLISCGVFVRKPDDFYSCVC